MLLPEMHTGIVKPKNAGRPRRWDWEAMKPGESFDTKSVKSQLANSGNRYAEKNNLPLRFSKAFREETGTDWIFVEARSLKKSKEK